MVQKIQNFSIVDCPVDIVYLWCDSSDEAWREKKNNELKKYGKNLDDDAVGECRFIDNDELKYSLRSLEKFAPWINNIFIVTDNQVPKWLDTTNPKIHIVNHSEILPSEALPTFNSMAVETVLHKIPNLSEHFLFANDDMFFGNFVEKDFFYNNDGEPIVRFLKRKIIRKIYRRLYGYTISESYKLVKNKIGKSWGYFPHHNIDAYRKSDLENCICEFSEIFNKTMMQKFREKDSVQRSIYGYYTLAKGLGEGRIVNNLSAKFIAFLTSHSYDSMLIELKKSRIKFIDKRRPYLFCFNDSLKTTNEDRIAMKQFLDEKFPKPSSFEKNMEVKE